MSSLLSTRDLTLSIGDRTLITGLNLAIEPGECWAVLGPNGTGKTTLLHTLAGLRPAQCGDVLWQGSTLQQIPRKTLARDLGLLLQDDSDPFPATVLETALTGRHPHLARWAWESPADLQLARRSLRAVDLADLAERTLDTLSGGERRRLAIATLLTQSPRLALLDEPTNHLDLRHQVGLLQRLQSDYSRDGHAAVMVLHDLNLALRYCDRLLLLHGDGRWEAGAASSLATADRLSALYGYPLRAVDDGERQVFLPA